ncbi:MAG: hypothetical protein JRI36_00355 [Deltaproteobacteria bacterium]|nr:hypothetical protein [Deltaproteobacteria bacterium]
MVFEIAAIMGLAFCTRFLFLCSETSDYYVHLWLIKLFKQGISLRKKEVKNALNKGIIGAPPLPYCVIAKFPERYWIPIGLIGNIVYDVVTTLAFYVMCRAILGSASQDVLGCSAAFVTTLLYTTTPILHPTTARLKTIGARTLGNLFCFLYFTCLGYFMIAGDGRTLIGCGVFGLLIVLSSKFALQVLVFLSLGLSAFYWSVWPILVCMAVLLTGVLIVPLGVWEYLKTRLYHFKWYCKKLPGRTIDDRNSFRILLALPRLFLTNPARSIRFVFDKCTPVILLYSVPVLPFVLYWACFSPTDVRITQSPVLYFCLAITLTALAVFVLTSTRPFLFLGQAERYFEYALPAAMIIFSSVCINSGYIALMVYMGVFNIVFVLLGFIYSNHRAYAAKLAREHEESFEMLIEYLKTCGLHNIATVPTKLSNKLATYLPQDYRFYFYNIHEKGRGLNHILENHIAHHLFHPDLKRIGKKFQIELVVVMKEALELYPIYGYQKPFGGYEKRYENDRYVVFGT